MDEMIDIHERIFGSDNIADYLGITRSWLYRLKKRFTGTDLQPPLFERRVGPPGRRRKEIYTTKTLIQLWWLQYKNKSPENF